MRILLAGDWHGNITHAMLMCRLAAQNNCDAIIQLGDFGYWEHTEPGQNFLRALELEILKNRIPIYWIDGNHENHAMLRANYEIDGFTEIRTNLFYIPRGHTWEWDGVKMMGFGGAYSIDKGWRDEGIDWWPEEQASEDEILYAQSKGEVDVLLAHDCPWENDIIWEVRKRGGQFFRISEADESRQQLSRVLATAKPKLIYHGHYHIRYTSKFVYSDPPLEARITGLAHNYTDEKKDSYLIVDTQGLKEYYLEN